MHSVFRLPARREDLAGCEPLRETAALAGIGGGLLSVWIVTVCTLAFSNTLHGSTDNVDRHVCIRELEHIAAVLPYG